MSERLEAVGISEDMFPAIRALVVRHKT